MVCKGQDGKRLSRQGELMKSHREMYPEQYTHPLVGKRVTVGSTVNGIVTRVVPSRFGQLAEIDGNAQTFFRVVDCHEN